MGLLHILMLSGLTGVSTVLATVLNARRRRHQQSRTALVKRVQHLLNAPSTPHTDKNSTKPEFTKALSPSLISTSDSDDLDSRIVVPSPSGDTPAYLQDSRVSQIADSPPAHVQSHGTDTDAVSTSCRYDVIHQTVNRAVDQSDETTNDFSTSPPVQPEPSMPNGSPQTAVVNVPEKHDVMPSPGITPLDKLQPVEIAAPLDVASDLHIPADLDTTAAHDTPVLMQQSAERSASDGMSTTVETIKTEEHVSMEEQVLSDDTSIAVEKGAPVDEIVQVAPVEHAADHAAVEEVADCTTSGERTDRDAVEEVEDRMANERSAALAAVEEVADHAAIKKATDIAPVEVDQVMNDSDAAPEEIVSVEDSVPVEQSSPVEATPVVNIESAGTVSPIEERTPIEEISVTHDVNADSDQIASVEEVIATGQEDAPVAAVEEFAPVEENDAVAAVEEIALIAPDEEIAPVAAVEKIAPVAAVEENTLVDPVEENAPVAVVKEITPVSDVEDIAPQANVEEIVPVTPVEEIASVTLTEEVAPIEIVDAVDEVALDDEIAAAQEIDSAEEVVTEFTQTNSVETAVAEEPSRLEAVLNESDALVTPEENDVTSVDCVDEQDALFATASPANIASAVDDATAKDSSVGEAVDEAEQFADAPTEGIADILSGSSETVSASLAPDAISYVSTSDGDTTRGAIMSDTSPAGDGEKTEVKADSVVTQEMITAATAAASAEVSDTPMEFAASAGAESEPADEASTEASAMVEDTTIVGSGSQVTTSTSEPAPTVDVADGQTNTDDDFGADTAVVEVELSEKDMSDMAKRGSRGVTFAAEPLAMHPTLDGEGDVSTAVAALAEDSEIEVVPAGGPRTSETALSPGGLKGSTLPERRTSSIRTPTLVMPKSGATPKQEPRSAPPPTLTGDERIREIEAAGQMGSSASSSDDSRRRRRSSMPKRDDGKRMSLLPRRASAMIFGRERRTRLSQKLKLPESLRALLSPSSSRPSTPSSPSTPLALPPP